MKKLINSPRDFVAETVTGFIAAYPDLIQASEDPAELFVHRRGGAVPGKVGLVSGGGSGHEPLHLGFVGPGMLDAAVPGPVFTAPTPNPILAATHAADGGAGVLYIVKNYTGDVLNFETAAELAAADGIDVKTVTVNDDVAVQDSLYTAGRRGVAGTVLVEKIAGASAERGDDLSQVAAIAAQVNDRTRSMGVALHSSTVPHTGLPSMDLAEEEIEIGVGIHGEPGRERVPISSANDITDRLLDAIISDLDTQPGQDVLLFVNGMGASPLSELHLVFGHAQSQLERIGVNVARSLVGNYTTALDMQGCSITVLTLTPELTALWDAPVHTPAMRSLS